MYTQTPLEDHEIQRLERACVTAEDKIVLWTLLDTGIRVSELAYLQVADVHFDTRSLWRVNPIPLTERTFTALHACFQLQSMLFLNVRRIQRIVRALAVRADIRRSVTPQILRHTFAVRSLRAGMPIETLRSILGHNSINTTEMYIKTGRSSAGLEPTGEA
jgi:integrase/recombinase XerD